MVKVLQAQEIRTPSPARPATPRRASGADFGAQEAQALGQVGNALDVASQVAAKYENKRQKAEDKAFLDRADLELSLGYQRITEEEKEKASSGAERFFPTVRERFETETDSILDGVVEEHGYRPSDDARARAKSLALNRQKTHLGRAITFEHNERVRHLRSKIDESVALIAESEAKEGNIDGALARTEQAIDSYADVLTPADVAQTRENAAKVLFDRFRAASDPETFEEQANKIIEAFKEERDDEGATFTGAAADADLVGAIIQQESDGDPNAVSHAGAIGLMQVMPSTGREIAQELGDTEALNMSAAEFKEYLKRPEVSRQYGTHYINKMLERYDGDLDAALIAYNGGPKRADRWLASDRDDSVLPRETRRYYKEVKGRMDGAPEDASVQGAFVEHLIENRDTLKRDANRALEGKRFEMKQLLEADRENVRRFGEGIEGIDLEKFSRVLTDNQINRHLEKRREAKMIYDATNDLWGLSDEQITERLNELEPQPGEPDISKFSVYEEATDIADDIRTMREKDPAKSVAELDVVKQAAENVDPDDPRTVQALVQARLDAQERVGVPETVRRPITRAEAKVIVAPIKDVPDAELFSAMEDLAVDLEERYGNLTDEVMTAAVEMMIGSRSTAELMSSIISSFVRKGTIPQVDIGRLREEFETEATERAMNPSRIADEAQDAFSSSSELDSNARALEDFLSTQTPPNKAIQFLRQHPEMAPEFDAKYGTGSAQRYLEDRAAQ